MRTQGHAAAGCRVARGLCHRASACARTRARIRKLQRRAAPGGGPGTAAPGRCCPGCGQSSRESPRRRRPPRGPVTVPTEGERPEAEQRLSAPAPTAADSLQRQPGGAAAPSVWSSHRRCRVQWSPEHPGGGQAGGSADPAGSTGGQRARRRTRLLHQTRHTGEGSDATRGQPLVNALLHLRHSIGHPGHVAPLLPAGRHGAVGGAWWVLDGGARRRPQPPPRRLHGPSFLHAEEHTRPDTQAAGGSACHGDRQAPRPALQPAALSRHGCNAHRQAVRGCSLAKASRLQQA